MSHFELEKPPIFHNILSVTDIVGHGFGFVIICNVLVLSQNVCQQKSDTGHRKREFNLKNSHFLTEFATDREDEGEKGKINEEPLFC